VAAEPSNDEQRETAGLIASGVHRELGLTDDEASVIEAVLGRQPSPLELAMYAVMWSEHCSYKSSRLHLRDLPSSGERVLVGPGENAGVVDVGDGLAIALRIESHNHPSAIEPFQGAATGVGGILRDIFTMGARPVALMDPLFIGPLEEPRSRWILDGVVRGIAGYGNSVGVPTVGGQIHFSECYAGNPLVNVFCLGVLPVERLVLGRASGVGNAVVLLGARTGRDGIGGVSVLASAGFSAGGESPGGDNGTDGSVSKRPSVQIGDPFEEKRLIEACLELLEAGVVVGIQDLGGAGLSCATSETAARGQVGMDVDVRAVPCREPRMTPVEVMTSESQERMLAIVTQESLPELEAICTRWEVQATVIGRVVEPGADGVGMLRILDGLSGEVLAAVPASSLADDAPLYDRPRSPSAPPTDGASDPDRAGDAGDAGDLQADLASLLEDPAWIYRQYDHQLFLNTVVPPGAGDAAVLRLGGAGIPRTGKAVALSSDGNPGWCAVDARAGAAATVAESALNVACAGATPLATVNCLNFGNPEHPEVMRQLSEAIAGMAEACRALGVPVVGGNVSLYNETAGVDIEPTPVIATVGLIEQLECRPPVISLVEGGTLLLLGPRSDGLGGSRWARQLRGLTGGTLPPLDMALHAKLIELVSGLVRNTDTTEDVPLLEGIHDVSSGGLGVCLAELATGGPPAVGVRVAGVRGHRELFSEAPSRVVICTRRPDEVRALCDQVGVEVGELGVAGGDRFVVEGLVDVALDELSAARSGRLSRLLDPA
jgi:phosphoribosylformylglycinamidine synthase II